MTDENNKVTSETEKDPQFSFIKETIRPKKRTRLKKIMFTCGLAVLFGLISSVTFCAVFPVVSNWMGWDRTTVLFDKSTLEPSARPTIMPTIEPTVVPTKEPVKTASPKPSANPGVSQAPIIITNEIHIDATIEDFQKIYKDIDKVMDTMDQSILTVISVKSSKDVFEESYEKADETAGIIVANNNAELLILVQYDRIKEANRLRVRFHDMSITDATMLSIHEELGLAVLAVKLSDLAEDTISGCNIATLGESYSLAAGDVVLAVGNPNGYMYSRDIGIISNELKTTYVTDNCIELIHTNLRDNAYGDGVLINLKGEVVGILSRQFKKDLNEKICMGIGISRLKPMIERMVNKEEFRYFGVKANDITPEVAEKVGFNSGIYISKVESNSPAFEAGIKAGDIIQQVDETAINTVKVFYNILNNKSVNEDVNVQLVRKRAEEYESLQFTVKIKAR